MFVFEDKDQAAWECYKNAIANKNYEATCDFSDVHKFLNVLSYENTLQTLSDDEMVSKHIIVDNSPLPKGGANSRADLSTMLSTRTEFQMNYNIKTLTIYAGLLIISLLFATFGVVYIYCKTRADFNAKARKLNVESDGQFLVQWLAIWRVYNLTINVFKQKDRHNYQWETFSRRVSDSAPEINKLSQWVVNCWSWSINGRWTITIAKSGRIRQ